MQSIRRRLTIILLSCTIIAVLLAAISVNIAVDNTFNKYMEDNQTKRNQRIVDYFQEIYKKDKKWTDTSGKELQHEGTMSNYCLILLDGNKKEIWGMSPSEIKNMNPQSGQYSTSNFELKDGNKLVGYISIGQYQPVLLSEEDINFKLSINRNIAISVTLIIIISILVSLKFSRQFSKPIMAVSETSVALSKGSYEARSGVKSKVIEINNLIISTNILGQRLEKQDELRKRLVSDISHEIRTPLNILQNNLEAMIDGIFPTTRTALISLNDEVIRFGKLLDNLNMLKVFEEEISDQEFKTVFLDEILSEVCQEFSVIASNKNIVLSFNKLQDEKYIIKGHEDKLRQVFINLLSNAIKFNKTMGTVHVILEQDKEHIIVKVQDTGIGIKAEDIPFIFERLYRSDKSRHEIEGSGVGLTIVKKLVEQHDAVISVYSDEGKGSCFSLIFNRIH